MCNKYLTLYYPNGQKKSEGNYDGQEPIGDHSSWYESGKISHKSVELSGNTDFKSKMTPAGLQNLRIALTPISMIF